MAGAESPRVVVVVVVAGYLPDRRSTSRPPWRPVGVWLTPVGLTPDPASRVKCAKRDTIPANLLAWHAELGVGTDTTAAP